MKNIEQFQEAVNALLKNIGAQKQGEPIVDYINTSTGREYSVYQPIEPRKSKEDHFAEARKHGLVLQYDAIRLDIEEEDLPSFGYCLVYGKLEPIVKLQELIEKIKLDWGHKPNAGIKDAAIDPTNNMVSALVNIGNNTKMYYLLYVEDSEKHVYCSNNLEYTMQKVDLITQRKTSE